MSATLLAIDTSSQYCSVALSHKGHISGEHTMTEQSHSEHVLPMVRRVLANAGVSLADLDVFVVGIGPGGFTGVRLGVAIVQGLAYATGKQVVPLSSLLALAQAAYNSNRRAHKILVANDARMNQVYWAVYDFDAQGKSVAVQEPSLGDLTDIAAFADAQDLSNFQLAGNAWATFTHFDEWRVEHELEVADVDQSAPNAADLLPAGQLGYALEDAIEPHHVSPLYVRDKIAQTIAERAATAAAKV